MNKDDLIASIKKQIEIIKEKIKLIMQQDYHSESSLRIYEIAKGSLGQHLTLNQNVPAELGCAESVSTVLKKSGIPGIPDAGFEGTNELYTFLRGSKSFVQVPNAEDGAVIVSPSLIGANGQIKVHGHAGICGKYGIMSNESDNGLFTETWSYQNWHDYYVNTLGLYVNFFRAV